MVLLNFSFTGENTTGDISFTLTQEYKFKNLFLKDIKYSIRNDKLEEVVNSMTANAGLINDKDNYEILLLYQIYLLMFSQHARRGLIL